MTWIKQGSNNSDTTVSIADDPGQVLESIRY